MFFSVELNITLYKMFVVILQVAIIAGNFDLAEIIKVHKASDVGEWLVFCQSFLQVLRLWRLQIERCYGGEI